jgi:hypothetical protein
LSTTGTPTFPRDYISPAVSRDTGRYMYLVFPCEDKSTALLYKLEPSTLITPKVDQVKDNVIKKETKKGKLISKKAKVKKEEDTP